MTKSGMKTVRDAVGVLQCFSASEPLLGVNEIAKRTGMHKSSVSRMMATLEDIRILERDPVSRRFRLGDGLYALAAPLFSRRSKAEIVRPFLEKLAATVGETASFNIWNGKEATVVDSAAGTNAIGHFAPIGMRNPAHCTSSGKVLLAFSPESDADAVLGRGLHRYTANTITDPQRLRAALVDIRKTGVAINRGEFRDDVGAVAVVVKDNGDRVAGALSISVPMYRFDAERQTELSALVVGHARLLSAALGHGADT